MSPSSPDSGSRSAGLQQRIDQSALNEALHREAEVEPIGIGAKEAAKLLGISESLFYEMKRDGRLGPEARRLGRARRFDRLELLDWWRNGCPPRGRWQAMREEGAK